MGTAGMVTALIENKNIIVDGYNGKIIINPSFRVQREYDDIFKQQETLNSHLDQLRTLPAETLDGQHVSLLINTGLQENASLSLSIGADGVGLFRTEIPFMSRDRFPAEEEQRVLYRQLLSAFTPRPVIMRTLDIGGDKPLSYFPIEEENPFLGWRGIRVTLDHPEVFLVQLRAMLKANKGLDNLRIMLPMISHVGEVNEALRLIHKAHKEVQEEDGSQDISMPPIGVMIEVPAAVYQLSAIAKNVDFMSVGSNDLIQYLLAVDRNNSRVAYLYDGLQPAILHCLAHIIHTAKELGKPVSICGEMAGDPLSIMLLLGMGFNALSMNSASLLRVKWIIRSMHSEQFQELWQQAMTLEDPQSIRALLEAALMKAGLGALIQSNQPSDQTTDQPSDQP
jgi:phosphotransferase system enzyme I (PtsP)